MARLTVLCGLPGSGKTSMSKRLIRAHGGVRMCPDEWMQSMGADVWDEALRAQLEAGQWGLAKDLLLAGTDVVIEWGTWAREEREVLRTWCRQHGLEVSLVHLEVPREELLRRLAVRSAMPDEVRISPEHIDEWFDGPWHPPTKDEVALYDPIDLPAAGSTSRRWRVDDVPFLWDMLYESIHVREGQARPPRSLVDEPDIAHYLRDFGRRDGDDAEVAEDASGARVGAAFCRRMPVDDPGYGFVAEDIPEFGMAVVAECRGRGVGRTVLEALLARHPLMSLSVDDDNMPARRFYESLGFVDVETVGTSTTMVRRQ